jgi:hypothetical protein
MQTFNAQALHLCTFYCEPLLVQGTYNSSSNFVAVHGLKHNPQLSRSSDKHTKCQAKK